MSDNLPGALRENEWDKAAAALRAIYGVVPVVGGALGELVTQVIPNQRSERFARYLLELKRCLIEIDARLVTVEVASANGAFASEQVALFEEGASQAVRATTNERVGAIAHVVAHGMTADEQAAFDSRRLLQLIAELSEDDVIFLCSKTHLYGSETEWRDRHEATLSSIGVHMQSSQEDVDRGTLRSFREGRLARLGVLEEKASISGRTTYFQLSALGFLILRRLGLITDDER